MATYKCPTLGDCERANAGEIFDRGPGEDLHCPSCKTLLELQAPAAKKRTSIKFPVIGGAVIVLIFAIGGGTFLYRQHESVEAAPVAMATEVAPSPAAASGVEPTAGGIAPSSEAIASDRIAGEKRLKDGDAAGAATASNSAAAKELIKVAIADMAQGKLDDAEKQLSDAQARDPKQSLVFYNLGVLRIKQGRTDDALKAFEASFLNGFQYFDALAKDPDLNGIRLDPRFQALLKKYQSGAA